jgi:Zn-finger nucleic acid-binding protein
MELFASKGYFFCRYCGSFHFPDSRPDDGIRVVGADGASCAVCNHQLATAMLDETHSVRYCGNCRGVLLSRREFAGVVQNRRAWATDVPGPPVPLNPGELERRVNCPVCKARMMTHPYYGPGNVVLDSCEPCELIWLDFGELRQIVDAPGKDRGTRQHPRPVQGEDSLSGARYAPSDSTGDSVPTDLLDLLVRLF